VIVFELSCDQEHRFEGWFRSAEDFSRQQEQGLVSCPHCNSPQVRKLPSGLHIGQRATEPAAPAGAAEGQGTGAMADPAANPMAAYRQVVDFLMNISDDVGNAFAEEARKMHYEEAPQRSIRGQATDDEFAELEEEGIGVFRLPVPKKGNLN